jgi:hypothetical protein
MAIREIAGTVKHFLGTLGALARTIFSNRKASAFPPAAGGKAAPVTGFGATGNAYE